VVGLSAIPVLSLCAELWKFSAENSVLATPLTVQKWEVCSLPIPVLQGEFSIPLPAPPMSVLDYSSLFMAFSFASPGSYHLCYSVCCVSVKDSVLGLKCFP
jgi:hypothetical protein